MKKFHPKHVYFKICPNFHSKNVRLRNVTSMLRDYTSKLKPFNVGKIDHKSNNLDKHQDLVFFFKRLCIP